MGKIKDQNVEAVAEPEDPAHAEWLERVKRDEMAEADARVRRAAQAAREAEVAKKETAMQAGVPADEEPVAAEDDE